MRTCLELCTDFPVEKALLGLIDYTEAMEESMIDSRLEEVIELVKAYLSHPAKEV